ncbi:MAG: hypothetical protein KGQ40_03305 [Rhodospirillales bacterium]|nr:hypothetical protein [Rhodospirillales bacterium]
MRASFVLLAAVLQLAACGAITPPPDSSILPADAFGAGNAGGDVWAVNWAAWAFADPSRTAGKPIDGARMAADMEYLGGALATNPSFAYLPLSITSGLLAGRMEVRAVLGVPPQARSQAVVDGLEGAARALVAGDQTAARAALDPGIFTLGPDETLARLAHLPYMPEANSATLRASNALLQPGNDCLFCD